MSDPRATGGRVKQAGETRSAAVESLRALAALSVVLAHTYVQARYYGGRDPGPETGWWQRLIVSISCVVPVFFALSGYLLYLPFAKQAFTGRRRVDLRRFATNRALRILPLYYVSLAVYMTVAHAWSNYNVVMFGTFSENFANATQHTVNPALWTLALEFQFYVLLPFLAYAIARMGRGSLARALWVVAALGLASLALRWITVYTTTNENPILRDSFPNCFVFLAIGMALALLRLSWEQRRPALLNGPLGAGELWVVGSICAYLAVAWVDHDGRPESLAAFLVVGAVVLPLRNERVTRVLSWRPLAVLGAATYSLYVWHMLIIQRLSNHFHIQSFPELLVVVVPPCILVALASYALIERPFLSLRKGWGATAAGRQEARRVSAPPAEPLQNDESPALAGLR